MRGTTGVSPETRRITHFAGRGPALPSVICRRTASPRAVASNALQRPSLGSELRGPHRAEAKLDDIFDEDWQTKLDKPVRAGDSLKLAYDEDRIRAIFGGAMPEKNRADSACAAVGALHAATQK